MKKRQEIRTPGPTWVDRVAMLPGKRWLLVAAFAFLLTPTYYLTAALNSGAEFLKIDTGARPAAMGGAYTALADDINALYYNPGGLSRLRMREFGATHTEWIFGSKFDFAGYAHPTPYGTFGLGITRLATGGQDGRGKDRQATSGFEASDSAYTLGFGRSLGGVLPTGSINLGANVKLLQSRIGTYSASTVAMDVGLVHQFRDKPLTLGMSVLNLGRGMRFRDQTDPLPLTIAVGGAYRLAGILNLALDVRHEPYDRRTDLGIGTEYAVFQAVSLRAGYASIKPVGVGGSPLNGLGGGLGIRLNNYRADYTFTPFGELGNAQRISLGMKF